MLQRVQTLYLFGVTVCMIVMFFLPLLGIETSQQPPTGMTVDYVIGCSFNNEFFNFIPAYLQHTLLILIVDSCALSIITIFCFKKRKLQLKLCWLNVIFLVLLYAAIAYLWITTQQNSNVTYMGAGIAIALPFIALIFNFLAMRFIKKDEALIKSMDRIR